MSNFSFAEHTKVIPIQAPVSITNAAMTTEWICAKHVQKLTWFVYLGVLHSSIASVAFSIAVANDASGTKKAGSSASTASMDFVLENVWQTGVTAAASCDVLTKQTISTSSSVESVAVVHTDDGTMFVIEVDTQKLGTFSSSSSNYDADYVRLVGTASGAAKAQLTSVMCIATGLRYKEDSPATILA